MKMTEKDRNKEEIKAIFKEVLMKNDEFWVDRKSIISTMNF